MIYGLAVENLKEIEGWGEVSDILSQWSECATGFEEFAHEQQSELDNIVDRLENYSVSIRQLQEKSQQSRAGLAEAENKAHQSSQRCEELEQQLQELETAHNEIVDEAEERLQQLSQENQELASQRVELDEEVGKLREFAEQFEVKLEELESSRSALEDLRAELESAKRTVSQQQAEISQAEFGTKNSDEQINELEQEVADLRRELDESRSRASKYKDQLSEERAEWHTELKLLRKAVEMNTPDDGHSTTSPSRPTNSRPAAKSGDRVVDRLARQFKRLQTPEEGETSQQEG